MNTTGAGDVFAGGFLAGLVRGIGLEQAGKLAVYLAADVITLFGTEISDEAKEYGMRFRVTL